MFTQANKFWATVLLVACFGSATAQTHPADADVPYLATQLASTDTSVATEASVIVRWTGINDPRIFDPIASKLENAQVNMEQALFYLNVLSYTGSAKYLPALDAMLDPKRPNKLQREARQAKDTLARQQHVSAEINKGTELAKTNSELWAIRHRNGLAVQDSVRMRLAARDIYLHKRGPESLAVAVEALQAIDEKSLIDRNRMDGLAFLCKALGMAGDRKYLDVLVRVANSTSYDKLADYAERAAQYYDPQFKRTPRQAAQKKR